MTGRDVLACVALSLAGCRTEQVFTCQTDDDCRGGPASGRCEPTGACSFIDTKCASGWRYGEFSASAGDCVAVNLIANPSFETGVGGWNGYDSSLMPSDIPHSGAHSALVCANPTFTFFTILDSPASEKNAAIGDVYAATAWVRAAPGSPAQLIRLAIQERTGTAVEMSTSIAPDDTWRLLSVMHTIQVAGAVGIVVQSTGSTTGACFLVDDAAFAPAT